MLEADLAVLESGLGHSFQDRDLLVRALTHKSWAYEQNTGPGLVDNEQLEFLGDAILGFLASEVLLKRYPGFPEGQLSKLKSHLVSAVHLHLVAQALSLGSYLRLGRGEEMSGGREKKALLGDAVEAVLAAMYLDGGLDAARRFVDERVIGSAEQCERLASLQFPDSKTTLKELAQSLRLPQPRYSVVAENGPAHAKVFTVEARVGGELVSRGEGSSKKSAEQNAARGILELIEARE